MVLVSTRIDARTIVESLGGKWHRTYGMVRCPVHHEKHPSLSISDGDRVPIVAKCHAGCDIKDIITELDHLGLWPSEALPPPPRLLVPNGNGKYVVDPDEIEWPSIPTRTSVAYDYTDEHGVVLFRKIRTPDKKFRQEAADGTPSLDGVRRVLYRLPELLVAPQDALVFICEGEKDADRLTSLGLVATTNHEGAGTWDDGYSRWLIGRTVIVLQDNDDAGAKHARTVVASLQDLAASAAVLLLPGLPEKGDVSDWLDAGGTVEELQRLALEKLTPISPFQSIKELFSMTSIDDPELVAGLLWKGRTHWVFSAPNSGKTLLLLALGLHIAAGRDFHGRQVTQGPVVMVEEDSPLSVIAEYVAMLADIYDIDLDGLPFSITREPGLRIADESGKAKIIRTIDAMNPTPVLIIFDSSERIIPSDKYSTKEFDPFGSSIQHFSAKGITIAVIDHTRKLPTPIQAKNGKTAPRAEPDPIDMLYGGRVKSAIADIMMYIKGKVSKVADLQFVKFRGEEPPQISIEFQPDSGFSLRSAGKMTTKTPTEQSILAWIQNGHSQDFYTSAEIFAGAKVKDRTGERALLSLVKRQWLVKEGVTKAARFKLNPGLPGVFD